MAPTLALKNLTKKYPGVVALEDVSFTVDAGEVRVLLGKNGAGKSTTVKILSGAVRPDSGTIELDGVPVTINGTHDAYDKGLCTVYQELSLIPGLTVAENISMGRWAQTRWLGIPVIDRRQIKAIAQEALDQLEVQLDLNMPVSRLPIAQQQLVEIAKALSFDPRILLLDEPTSALTAHEVEVLHRVVRRLASQNRAIIYVTHRLQEIPRIATSVTVLRDGRFIGTIPVSEATPQQIATMMFGENFQRAKRERAPQVGETLLHVDNLTRKGILENISFELRAGEVVGIAGLMGSGRTELLRAIFGRDKIDSGEISVHGVRVTHPRPAKMKALGVAFTPEDRKRQGLVMPHSVKQNLTLASLHRISAAGITLPKRERELAREQIDAVSIKTLDMNMKVRTLSGGNQQKVVVGNWLNTLPKILMLDEPSRGIDLQAKEQIFNLIHTLADSGLAVLFVSSEIEEVLAIADRILIMAHGRITADIRADSISIEELFALVMKN
ncbi:MAG: sugar ABC transporter ATP-binding protein [Anaerolineae bacterium]